MTSELQAAFRYIDSLACRAEEDHYGDHSGNPDRDIHGRVYALWDLAKLLSRAFPGDSAPARSDIIDVLDRMAAPLEEEFGRRPQDAGRDLGGRVLVLREVRAALIAGDHLRSDID